MEDMKREAYGNYKGEAFTIWRYTRYIGDERLRLRVTEFQIDIYPETMEEVSEEAITRLEDKYETRVDFYTAMPNSIDDCYKFLMDPERKEIF